jgi:hypothetical protein
MRGFSNIIKAFLCYLKRLISQCEPFLLTLLSFLPLASDSVAQATYYAVSQPQRQPLLLAGFLAAVVVAVTNAKRPDYRLQTTSLPNSSELIDHNPSSSIPVQHFKT